MRDRDADRLNAEALKIMRYATVAQIKDDSDELAMLFASLPEPERAKLAALLFGLDD